MVSKPARSRLRGETPDDRRKRLRTHAAAIYSADEVEFGDDAKVCDAEDVTKQDYELIARMFALTEPVKQDAWNQWNAMRELLVFMLMDNPKFNADRFRTACERTK